MSRFGDPYAAEVGRLARSATATEPSFYPAIKTLLSGILAARGLAFDVRINTSERREGGGTDLPDVTAVRLNNPRHGCEPPLTRV